MKDLDKIENKLEKIDERIDSIDKHLAVYNSQLRFHIKRTDMLEEELNVNKCSFCKEPCKNKWCSYEQDRGKIRQYR